MYLSQKVKKDSYIGWIISLSAAGFFFFDFVQISMMNTLGKDLIRDLGMSQERISGYINIAFSLGNWLWIFPAALLIDRLSVRHVTLSMLGLSIIGALGTAWSPSPFLAALFRFCSGTAHAFCFLCCTTLVSRWFTSSQRAIVMSLAVAIGISGLLAAQLPLYYFKNWLGWRGALSVNAGLGILCWVVAFFFIADYPADAPPIYNKIRSPKGAIQDLFKALSNIRAWQYSLCTACLNAPIVAIVFTYLNNFLLEVHHVQNSKFASAMSTLLFLGHIVGTSCAGLVSNRWQSRKKPLFWASLLSFLLFLFLLLYTPLPPQVIAPLLFLLGMLLGAQVISYPAIAELSEPHLAASSMSIASFVIMGSIPFIQLLTDRLLIFAQKHSSLGVHTTYLCGFSPSIILLCAGTLLCLALEETYQKESTSASSKKS